MGLGRNRLGVGGFGAPLVVLSLSLAACAGKSSRDGGDDGDGNGGTSRGGSAGSSTDPTDPPGRGVTAGAGAALKALPLALATTPTRSVTMPHSSSEELPGRSPAVPTRK